MSLHPFLLSLGFTEDADIDAVERRFLEVVKDHIQKVASSYDEEEVTKEEAWLRDIHARYYQYSLQWIAEQIKQKKESNHADASKLKKQGRDVMDDLQKHITEFASCYMHINRFMTLLRDEMKKEEIRLAGNIAQNVKWTADAGTIIARHKQQRQILIRNNRRMKEARDVLERLEPDFYKFKESISKLYGIDKLEAMQRPVIAALRMGEFDRAHKALKTIFEGKKKFGIDQKTADDVGKELMRSGKVVIDACQLQKETLLSDEGRLFLRPIETDQAYNAQVRELRKIKGFLSKYYFPYMQYKLDTLLHLKDKLLVNGSLESLMTLYKKLISGMARPMPDIKAVRAYESEVLDRIKYLLAGQFQELANILGRADETVQEFRQGARDFRDAETMDLKELDVKDDDTAITA